MGMLDAMKRKGPMMGGIMSHDPGMIMQAKMQNVNANSPGGQIQDFGKQLTGAMSGGGAGAAAASAPAAEPEGSSADAMKRRLKR